MVDELIVREEVVALLFAVHGINETLLEIELLLRGDNGEAEADE